MSRFPQALHQDHAESVGRGILWIVLTGIVLGLGYNYLGLMGEKPHRGLPWISRPIVLDSLEGLKAAQVQDLETRPALPEVVPPADPAVAPETAPARTEPPQPVASAPAADAPEPEPEAKPAAPPEVPDVGRPLQVQLQAVKQFWDAKAALILDAREPAEYAEGHIPGAINLPADEVIADPERLDAVDSGGRPIICYCGGGSCEVSIHLAEALVYQSGKKRVLVFMGGWPEWEAAGYPVEK